MKYLNKSFHVPMPDVSQEKWDRIFSKDSEVEVLSLEKIREAAIQMLIDDVKREFS